jgi:hypothetical protein
MRKSIFAPLVAIALAVGLAGCVPVSSVTERDIDPPAAVPDDTITPPSMAPEPEPEVKPTDNLAFGDAATYEDGVSVSVSTATAYTPDQYASGADFPHNLSFTITITNGTAENLDAYAYTTITSGGQSGSQIFDGNSSYPSGVILPGQALSWVENWSVADPNSIVLSIQPGFDYLEAIFTNVPA